MVLLCLALAFAPASLRGRLRSRLLDLHGFVQRLAQDDDALADAPPETAGGARIRLLEAEVLRLRRALAGAGTAQEVLELGRDVALIPAEVLPLGGPADLVHRIALARGSRDGVREGQPVLADGVLLGQVVTVGVSTCEVRLVSDPRFTIRASVARAEQEVEGLLRGDGSGLLVFEPAIVDPTAPPPQVFPGEAVHCSRASVLCGVPALIGVVERVERAPGAPLPWGRVLPAREATGVRQVVIVRVGASS